MPQPHFNILTRTTQRPRFFESLCKSLDEQTYENWSHHVITDDPGSVDYVRKFGRSPILTKRHPVRTDIKDHFPYNLYLNELYKETNDGYVIVIDDDDFFMETKALEFLSLMIRKIGNDPTLFWRVKFPDGYRPREKTNFIFKPGNIASCGFCFHTKYLDAAMWDEFKESDFRVAHKVKLVSEVVYYLKESVVTSLQRAAGFGGFGQRDDKKRDFPATYKQALHEPGLV